MTLDLKEDQKHELLNEIVDLNAQTDEEHIVEIIPCP
jgi:hypothetical protein